MRLHIHAPSDVTHPNQETVCGRCGSLWPYIRLLMHGSPCGSDWHKHCAEVTR